MMKTRILALLLVFCMLFGVLAGCSKEPGDDTKDPSKTDDNKTPSSQTTDAAQQTSAKYVYTLDEMPLTLDMEANYVSPMCVAGNYLYLTADVITSSGNGGDVDGDMGIAPLTTDDATVTAEDGGSISKDPDPDAIIDDPVEEPVSDEPVSDEIPAEEPADDKLPAEEPSTDGGVEVYTSETRLYRVDLTTGEAEQMPGFTPPEIPAGYSGYTGINRVLAGSNDTVWIYDSMDCYLIVSDENGADYDGIHYDSGDYVEGPSVYRLQQFSASGEVLRTIDMAGEDGGYTPSRNLNFIDANDHLYFNNWQDSTATVQDADGNVLKSFDLSENNGSLMTFCDQAAVQTYDYENNKSEIRLIDPETFELGEPIETPANAWSFMKSYDEAYDFYYELNSDLYGYKQKEQVSEQVVSWMDCDIDSNYIQGTYSLPDGRILGILNENGGGGMIMYDAASSVMRAGSQPTGYTLLFLTKTDASTVKPKTVLTMACMYTDWDLKSRIVAFNKTSEDYRIIIKDYSQYATNDDYNAGVTKLNTEILSGQIPDLIYTANLPISQYAVQGILTDLRPYIDADPELSGDHLMTHVLDAASIDGKLYQAFSSFSIGTAVGLSKVVGGYDQWTLTEVKDALTKLQPGAHVFSFDMTRQQMLSTFFSRSYSSYVDWENGTCSFDGQDFRDLLEFVNTLPENFSYDDIDWSQVKYDVDALNAGEQLLLDTGLYSLNSYAWTLASFGGQDITFVGYPSASGNNNVFNLTEGLCITSTCKDKDGAWQFVRTLFTKEYQEENSWYGLPTNADVFNETVKDMMTVDYLTDSDGNYILDENGEKTVSPKASYWFDDDTTYDIDALTQEQVDQIMDLYNSTELVSADDEEILNIINEETAGYFAGQKSLDDTVRLIQNRVSLYVAEQK